MLDRGRRSRIGIDPRNLSLSATMFAALPRSAKLSLCGLWSCPAARKDIFIVQFETSHLAHRGWGKVGRKRGQCHWEVGDCLEFEDDFYMATCHKYIHIYIRIYIYTHISLVLAASFCIVHMTASHMPASQKMYVGGALRSMRLSCTSVERDTRG